MPENDQDIFALKVDSFGLITNIPKNATWQMNDAILCPKPGSVPPPSPRHLPNYFACDRKGGE